MDNIFDNMYVGRDKRAWHNKGKTVNTDGILPSELVAREGMGYKITREPLYIRQEGGQYVKLPEVFGVVREPLRADPVHRLFRTVSDQYEALSNLDAFSVFDEVVTHAKWPVETMLVLGKGERAILTLSTGKHHIKSKAGKLDEHELFLAFINDQLGALRTMMTEVRIVCENTYNFALRDNVANIEIAHRAGAKDQIKDVVGFIAQMYAAQADTLKLLQAWADRPMDGESTEEFVKKVFPIRERSGKEQLYSAANKAEMQASTAERAETYQKRFEQTVRTARRNQVLLGQFIDWEDQNHPEFAGTAYARFNGMTNYVNWGMGDTTRTPSPEDILLGDRSRIMNRGVKELIRVAKSR